MEENKVLGVSSGKQYAVKNSFEGVSINHEDHKSGEATGPEHFSDLSNLLHSKSEFESSSLALLSPSMLNLPPASISWKDVPEANYSPKNSKWLLSSLMLSEKNQQIIENMPSGEDTKNNKRKRSVAQIKTPPPEEPGGIQLAEPPENPTALKEVFLLFKPARDQKLNSLSNCSILKFSSELQNLYAILIEAFVDGRICEESYVRLASSEKNLLHLVIERKLSQELKVIKSSGNPVKCVKIINSVLENKAYKRPEESYKFALARVIQHLKLRLASRYPSVEDPEALFYEVYFESVAIEMNVPLCKFYYPLAKNKGPMKFNKKYLALLLKSKVFLSHTKEYMELVYQLERKAEICKKFKSLMSKWGEMLARNGLNEATAQAEIALYLKDNKGCKLPWTLNEAQDAAHKFMAMIDSLNP